MKSRVAGFGHIGEWVLKQLFTIDVDDLILIRICQSAKGSRSVVGSLRNLESEFEEVNSWLIALRLFKPGIFRVGGIWNMAVGSHSNQLIAVQESLMHPENATEIYDRVREGGYRLEPSDVPFLSKYLP